MLAAAADLAEFCSGLNREGFEVSPGGESLAERGFDEPAAVAGTSGQRYALDSKITHAIRDLAPRFEQRDAPDLMQLLYDYGTWALLAADLRPARVPAPREHRRLLSSCAEATFRCRIGVQRLLAPPSAHSWEDRGPTQSYAALI